MNRAHLEHIIRAAATIADDGAARGGRPTPAAGTALFRAKGNRGGGARSRQLGAQCARLGLGR